jgi:oligoribonuclease NrnB/cAMP/cGMP phosphodiesterase (DHH superfamily)
MNPLCIYHGNCADGFTAAWAVRKAFRGEVDFHAGVYQTPPPDVTGRDVILVDFCYKPEAMRALSFKANSILLLDHHKSAEADFPHDPRTGAEFNCVWRLDRPPVAITPNWKHTQTCAAMDRNEGVGRALIYAYFDMNRSGAGIAWDFFHPGQPRPALVNHVEDRDLWRFALPGTREIQAAVFSHPYDFDAWDRLAGMDPYTLMQEGTAIERKHHKDVAELVKVCQRSMTIGGHEVLAASLPYTLTSDAGHLMAQGRPFAACYWDTEAGRVFSLRSTDEGMDVSTIAQQYGGGGHRNAAGFSVPRTHELAAA